MPRPRQTGVALKLKPPSLCAGQAAPGLRHQQPRTTQQRSGDISDAPAGWHGRVRRRVVGSDSTPPELERKRAAGFPGNRALETAPTSSASLRISILDHARVSVDRQYLMMETCEGRCTRIPALRLSVGFPEKSPNCCRQQELSLTAQVSYRDGDTAWAACFADGEAQAEQ